MRPPHRSHLVAAAALVAVLWACERGDEGDTTPDDRGAWSDLEAEGDAPDDDPDAGGADDAGEPDDAGEHDEVGGPDEPARVRPPDEVAAFDDPGRLAATLAAAERALADPSTPADETTRWAEVHQQAHRDLAANPRWRDEARAAVPAALRDAYDLTLTAVTRLHEMTDPREELPDWRIEAPPPVDELRAHYEATEAEFGVPWHVLAAIHHIETRFGRIHGDSHAGAQGPMQFMPRTWEAYGEGDVHDPGDAIMAAGRYLAASGAPDDLPVALYAYNRHDDYVEAVLAFAEAMERHEHYLDVYHGWRVYYRTVDGDVVLEEGYGE